MPQRHYGRAKKTPSAFASGVFSALAGLDLAVRSSHLAIAFSDIRPHFSLQASAASLAALAAFIAACSDEAPPPAADPDGGGADYTEVREPGFAPAPLLEHLVTAGYLGRKTGRGFRDHATP